MKKILSLILILTLVTTCLVAFTACDKENDPYARFQMPANAKDYSKLDLEYGEYPELNSEGRKQGLYLVKGYKKSNPAVDTLASNREIPDEVPADDNADFRANFKEDAPIIIIIHGVQITNGRMSNAYYWSEWSKNSEDWRDLSRIFFNDNSDLIAEVDDASLTEEEKKDKKDNIDQLKNIENKHWNVMYFHYEQFADAPVDSGDSMAYANAAGDLGPIVEECWTNGLDGKGCKLIQTDAENPNHAYLSEKAGFKGSLNEYFAAEYLRMVNAVKKYFPNYNKAGKPQQEIRVVCHSMGGVVTASSMTILAALIEAGQLDGLFAPDRVAFLDPYIGLYSTNDLTYAWNGNTAGNLRTAFIDGLNYFKGVTNAVIEMYVNGEVGIIPYMVTPDDVSYLRYEEELKQMTCYTVIYPGFYNVSEPVMTNGHNAMRDWYFYSYTYGEINVYDKDNTKKVGGKYEVKDPSKVIGHIGSAGMSTENLRMNVGFTAHQLHGSAHISVVAIDKKGKPIHVFVPFAENEK